MTYFNEHDPFAAQWLRNLYPAATVDMRSIHDVQPRDLVGFDRCHFFGGVGGWQLALDLAGWSGPVWTGSCPCQPYSSAGKGKGDDDARNLWPEMFRLIRECRPAIVFGEQVEAAIKHGWLDGICRDLEGEGYAVGAHVLGAHSVGAPHIRQRLYWVAVADGWKPGCGEQRLSAIDGRGDGVTGIEERSVERLGNASVRTSERDAGSVLGAETQGDSERLNDGRLPERLADAGAGVHSERLALSQDSNRGSVPGFTETRERRPVSQAGGCRDAYGGLGDTHGIGEGPVGGVQPGTGTESAGSVGGVEQPPSNGRGGERVQDGRAPEAARASDADGMGNAKHGGRTEQAVGDERRESGPVSSGDGWRGEDSWGDSILIPCRDGKARRVSAQSGDEPLVASVPKDMGPLLARLEGMGIDPKDAKRIIKAARGNRVGRLRGYGNAITVGAAVVFIRAVMEALDGH